LHDGIILICGYQVEYIMTLRALPVLLLLVLFSGCGRPVPRTTGPFEIFFSRKDDLPGKLVSLINSSQREIIMAAYEANLPSVLGALRNAEKRGVKVELLIDDLTVGDTAGLPSQVYTDRSSSSLMHAKFGVFDQKICWLGSCNLTFGSAYESDNDLLLIRSPEIAGCLRETFFCLTSGKTPLSSRIEGNRPLSIYFTPECRPALLRELRKTESEIFFSLYVLTDPEVIKLLRQKAVAGIKIGGVLERSWPGNRPAFAALHSAGIAVRWDNNYNLNHYKVFILDGRKVITGSYNPSRTAPENQEILAVIASPELAGIYQRRLSGRFGFF